MLKKLLATRKRSKEKRHALEEEAARAYGMALADLYLWNCEIAGMLSPFQARLLRRKLRLPTS